MYILIPQNLPHPSSDLLCFFRRLRSGSDALPHPHTVKSSLSFAQQNPLSAAFPPRCLHGDLETWSFKFQVLCLPVSRAGCSTRALVQRVREAFVWKIQSLHFFHFGTLVYGGDFALQDSFLPPVLVYLQRWFEPSTLVLTRQLYLRHQFYLQHQLYFHQLGATCTTRCTLGFYLQHQFYLHQFYLQHQVYFLYQLHLQNQFYFQYQFNL